MRPLSNLSHSQLSQVRGVIFDIDDTVTRDGKLELAAFDAMWRLRNAGVALVAVTGRPLGWADIVAKMWPVEFAVGENGAGWTFLHDGRMHHGYFASDTERKGFGALFERVRRAVEKDMPHVKVTADHAARRCDLAFDVGEYERLSPDDIARLVAIIEREEAKSSVSSVHAHAVAGDWDKAKGVVRAAFEVLGVDLTVELERWIFVGDSGNDEAAFSFFPLSVGVANVREHLPSMHTVPSFVTEASHGDGFAELAQAILNARSG